MLRDCDRCKEKMYKGEVCNYCGRVICYNCLKASKRVKRRDILKLYICKDCWSNTGLRKLYRWNQPKFVLIL